MKQLILFLLLNIAGISTFAQNVIYYDSVPNFKEPNFEHKYVDPYEGERHPWGWYNYEKEVLNAKRIIDIDRYHVYKYENRYMMGVYYFTGDTTKLVPNYLQRNIEGEYYEFVPFWNYPGKWCKSYLYYDTIYEQPTKEGFLIYKNNK